MRIAFLASLLVFVQLISLWVTAMLFVHRGKRSSPILISLGLLSLVIHYLLTFSVAVFIIKDLEPVPLLLFGGSYTAFLLLSLVLFSYIYERSRSRTS